MNDFEFALTLLKARADEAAAKLDALQKACREAGEALRNQDVYTDKLIAARDALQELVENTPNPTGVLA